MKIEPIFPPMVSVSVHVEGERCGVKRRKTTMIYIVVRNKQVAIVFTNKYENTWSNIVRIGERQCDIGAPPAHMRY